MAAKKRPQWRLPKEFETAPVVEGMIQRYDGEPRFMDLVKHPNDRTLHASACVSCCDCGLEHIHTYSVLKTPDGKWHLITRAYRVPGTGKVATE